MHSTSASLLEQLRQPSAQEAWSRFVKLYTPLLYHWVAKTGFRPQEADDLVQEVFAALVQVLPHFQYNREKSFRGWLRTVAVNKWREQKRARLLAAVPLGDQAVVDLSVPDSVEQFWEKEYRYQLVQQALHLMHNLFPENTWRACWDIVVEGKTAAQVAAEQGTTVAAAHAARFRVLKRLQQELQGMMD